VNQEEFFVAVLKALENCRIPYMIGGSVGAMVYGEPRLTNDIEKHLRDIAGMIQISGERLDRSYIEQWVHSLGLGDGWSAATRLAEADE